MARKSKVKGKGKIFKCIAYRMKKANLTRKQAGASCSASMKGGKGGKGGGGMCVYSKGRCHKRKQKILGR